MNYGQYELTMLYYQERRRQEQQWYTQWERENPDGAGRENVLRRIVRRLRAAAAPQMQGSSRAGHAPAYPAPEWQ